MKKDAVFNALTPGFGKMIWGAGYRPALPFNPQDYSLGATLPTILYLLRWGHRRGRGNFLQTFAGGDAKGATIDSMISPLLGLDGRFSGISGKAERAILGDLLLCYCFENTRREEGRDKKVIRALPVHFMSSWVDLPKEVSHLRGIPDLLVAILARQGGRTITPGEGRGHYVVRSGFDSEKAGESRNLLLSIFGTGVKTIDEPAKLKSDMVDESIPVDIDQWLMLRVAEALKEPPRQQKRVTKADDDPSIPNQLPIATLAAEHLFDDLNIFLRVYGRKLPRQTLLPMFESCLAIGMSNIFLSSVLLLLEWRTSRRVSPMAEQGSWPVFFDCTNGVDHRLRRVSEESGDDVLRRLMQLPAIITALRILDLWCEQIRQPLPPAEPDSAKRLDALGDVLNDPQLNRDLERDMRRYCASLKSELERDDEDPLASILDNPQQPALFNLAEAIVNLMGYSIQGGHYRDFLDASLMTGEPHGLSTVRFVQIRGRRTERRSFTLSSAALDFLVHRHLRKSGKSLNEIALSFKDFLSILRKRYGFYIDASPPGIQIPEELLRDNRNALERRLRDMGLFMGVNDAEAMKRLRSRFEVDHD